MSTGILHVKLLVAVLQEFCAANAGEDAVHATEIIQSPFCHEAGNNCRQAQCQQKTNAQLISIQAEAAQIQVLRTKQVTAIVGNQKPNCNSLLSIWSIGRTNVWHRLKSHIG